MKKMKKRFLAISICFAVLFGSLTPVQVADAAPKTASITVRYKGKNVTFMTYRNLNKSYSKIKITPISKKYATIKKKWGKAKKMTTPLNFPNAWNTGKSYIGFTTYKNGKLSAIGIDIWDKNASVCGVKVGMSKKQALQKLRKQFGKKLVTAEKNLIAVNVPPAEPFYVSIKSGKVESLYYMCTGLR